MSLTQEQLDNLKIDIPPLPKRRFGIKMVVHFQSEGLPSDEELRAMIQERFGKGKK